MMRPIRTGALLAVVCAVASGGVALAGGVATAGQRASTSGFLPAAHRKPPDLINGGGQQRLPLRIIAFAPSNFPYARQLAQFAPAMAHSKWLARLELAYGIPTSPPPIGRGFVVQDMPAFPSTSTTTNDVFGGWVSGQFLKHGLKPLPDYQTIVIIYATCPSGADIDGFGCSPHHPSMTFPVFTGSSIDAYALSDPDISGKDPEFARDLLTKTASHELAEAATDQSNGWHLQALDPEHPWVGTSAPNADDPEHGLTALGGSSPWVENDNGRHTEAGDVTGVGFRWYETYHPVDGSSAVRFEYQRIWSNYANDHRNDPAVPPIPKPYYDVTLKSDWYLLPVGKSKTVTVTGWSTKMLPEWTVAADVHQWAGSDKADSNYGAKPECSVPGTSWKVGNGGTFKLKVNATTSAKAGTWCVVRLISTSTASVEKNGDAFHQWFVGFILVQ